jgi:hypothetical protein
MDALDVTAGGYAVNTMTLTAKSGHRSIDLKRLCNEATGRIGGDSPAVTHVSFRDGRRLVRVGTVIKKNGRPRKYGHRMFDNQATIVVASHFDGEPVNVNIKVFRNGNVQMTGARSKQHGESSANAALCSYGGLVHSVDVHLMNCNFRVSHRINRDALHTIVRHEYGMISSFNPDIYPAVKIYFMYNSKKDGRCPAGGCVGKGGCCKRVTLLVFSGKPNRSHSSAIITGGVDTDQVDAVHAWFSRLLQSHGHRVVYPHS